ncbi:hypothetical protein KA977_02995 [Candidatus Dependentiae bacterium]|nr:hypothetical protein [Candidatus Dependentiae bacterium]
MKKFEFVENVPIGTNLKHSKIRTAQQVWPDMIKKAKKTIDICQFYISSPKGEDLYPIFGMIIDAAKNKGVKVRMINDAMYYNSYPTNVNFFENIGNMEVKFLDVTKMMGAGVMHAKYLVIDGEDCFVGSHNFDWKSLKHSQNLGVRVVNSQFADILTQLFEYDWKLADTNVKPNNFKDESKIPDKPIKLKGSDNISVYPVVSPEALTPKKFITELELVMELIENARKEILIHIMEYSPNSQYCPGLYLKNYDAAIREAAASKKIKVKLLTSHWSLKQESLPFVQSLSLIPNVEVRYMDIPTLGRNFVPFSRVHHVKYMVMDNEKAWLTSSNLEPDYFINSRNVGIGIIGKKPVKTLREVFDISWNSEYAREITADKSYPKPRIES